MAHLNGRAIKKRRLDATIFTDHNSDISYMHLQKIRTSEEMEKAERKFEACNYKVELNIRHYHTDNRRFQENAFVQLVKNNINKISLCGVNSHFQNYKA